MEHQYIRVRDADHEKLSELVVRAKGPRKSLRKFASELGVSHNTIRRIIDMGNSTNCNNELIFKIAEHAAPESGVTLEELMEAQGLVENKTVTNKYYMKTQQNFMMKYLIKNIQNSGYSVREVDSSYGNNEYAFDGIVYSDSVGKDGGLWAFDFVIPMETGIESNPGYIARKLEKVMCMFYTNKINVDKVSIVVPTRNMLEQIVNRFNDCIIPDEISIILLEGKEIKEEYIMPMYMRNPKSIFQVNAEQSHDVEK